jgi:hypothetical protein
MIINKIIIIIKRDVLFTYGKEYYFKINIDQTSAVAI